MKRTVRTGIIGRTKKPNNKRKQYFKTAKQKM